MSQNISRFGVTRSYQPSKDGGLEKCPCKCLADCREEEDSPADAVLPGYIKPDRIPG